MSLKSMEPERTWDPKSHEETVETLSKWADEITIKVWGGDWCGDCREQLPAFSAALEAAGVPTEHVEQYPVEKEADGSVVGPQVSTYGIEQIPTVVIERDGEELARFVESEDVSISEYLAARLREQKRVR